MDSLMTLIDRWHAHDRDGDPEAYEARQELILRLASIQGFAEGLALITPGAANAIPRLRELFDGRS